MKKLLAILAACTAMTLTFVSCGYSDDKSSEKDSKSSSSDSSKDKDDDSDSKSSNDNDSKDKDDDSDSKSSNDDDSNDKDNDSDSKNSNDDDSDSDSGADEAARIYAESIYGKNAAETYYSIILPDDFIDYMKNEEPDSWKEVIDEYNEEVDELLMDYTFEVTEVKQTAVLTKAQVASVEEYFSYELDCENTPASKGYEYHIEIEGTDADGEVETDDGYICVVKLKEGWKVIEETPEDLEYYYGE